MLTAGEIATIDVGLKDGDCYVVLCTDGADMFATFTALMTMTGVTGYVSSYKIRYLPSHGEIVLCAADNQQYLRGILREYKLIDPYGIAWPETLHRFR